MNPNDKLEQNPDSIKPEEDIKFKSYLKYHITFKMIINGRHISITKFQDISINSIRFKISKNGYNSNYDATKEYLFEKSQNEDYYESNNDYDYYDSQVEGDSHYVFLGSDVIEIDKIIIDDKYKFSNFGVIHTDINHKLKDDTSNNEIIYTIFITIILNENTIITMLNNNNKYTKLLKLLKKHLNSRNTNVKTLYYDLLNKIQQENTLIITTSSIININSLLKLLSEYLGINSKNPNILYHSLLTKK